MKFTCGLTFTLAVLLLVVATKGHTVIQCYVCDDCAKIDKNTPLEQCGGENFTMTSTTSSSMPASESKTSPSTEAATTSTTTTTATTPTTTTTTTTTTQKTTEFATPPTIGPISPTTDLPTPPSLEGSGGAEHDHNMNHSLPVANATTLTTPPSIFVTPSQLDSFVERLSELNPIGNFTFNETLPSAVLVRQRRHTEFNGITYHCYKVQKKYGNVYGTKRGCMGVKTEQSVCDELYTENGNQTKKCSPCSTTKCNGSSSLGVSIATLLVALMAVIYKV